MTRRSSNSRTQQQRRPIPLIILVGLLAIITITVQANTITQQQSHEFLTRLRRMHAVLPTVADESPMSHSTAVTSENEVASSSSTTYFASINSLSKQVTLSLEQEKQNVFEGLAHHVDGVVSGLHFNPASLFHPHHHLSKFHTETYNGTTSTPNFSTDPPPYILSDDQKAAIEARFATDPKALKMRNQSPRFHSTNNNEPEASTDYAISLAICFAIGIVIGFLQLICTGWYMFLRCCCWRCCCKKKSDWEQDNFPGYLTFWSKYWPVIFLLAFVALASAFAAVGLAFNASLSKTFSATDQQNGVGPLTIAVMNSMSDFVQSLKDIISNLSNSITAGASKIVIPPQIMANALSLTGKSDAFGNTYSIPQSSNVPLLYNVTALGTTYYCSPLKCEALGQAAKQVSTQINTQVIPQINSYDSTTKSAQTEYVDKSSSITDQLNSVSNSLDSAQGSIISNSTQKDINDYAKKVETYDGYRNTAFLVLFSLTFLSPLLTFLGLLFRKSCPFKTSFCLGPWYMLIIWFLFGLHWMLGMGIGDSCAYLDEKMVTVTNTTLGGGSGTQTLANVINSCLSNASLTQTLDLEKEFNFREQVNFPPPETDAQITARFTTPGLQILNDTAASMNTSSFGFDEKSAIDDNIVSMNAIPQTGVAIVYDRTQVRNCNVTLAVCYNSARYPTPSDLSNILSLADTTQQGLQVYDILNNEVVTIQSKVNDILNSTDYLKNSFNITAYQVEALRTLLDPIYTAVDGLRAERCLGIADAFGNFKNTFCNNLENSIQFITLALFLIGLSCFPITWCSRWSSYRVAFVPKVAPAPFNENTWMEQNGYAPAIAMAPNLGSPTHQPHVQNDFGQPQQQQETAPAYGSIPPPTEMGQAMNVPSYDAALASYGKGQDFSGGNFEQEQAAADAAAFATPEEVAEATTTAGVAIEQAAETNDTFASPSGASGDGQNIASPSAPATDQPTFASNTCESCESEPVAIRCTECDESLCHNCDQTLHRSAANAGHTRTPI